MEDNVAEAVGYLALLSVGGSQGFGTLKNNIQLLSIKKLKGDIFLEKKGNKFFLKLHSGLNIIRQTASMSGSPFQKLA